MSGPWSEHFGRDRRATVMRISSTWRSVRKVGTSDSCFAPASSISFSLRRCGHRPSPLGLDTLLEIRAAKRENRAARSHLSTASHRVRLRIARNQSRHGELAVSCVLAGPYPNIAASAHPTSIAGIIGGSVLLIQYVSVRDRVDCESDSI